MYRRPGAAIRGILPAREGVKMCGTESNVGGTLCVPPCLKVKMF